MQDYKRVAGLELLPELAQNASNGRLESLVRDLLEVRRRLVQMVIERVAERARPEDVAAVASAVTQLEQVAQAQAPLEQIAAADLDVMAAILAATRSSVLGLSLNPVLFVVRELAPLREAIYADPTAHVAAHRALLAWLEHPTPEAAEAVMAELERRDRTTIERVASRVEIPS